MVTKSIGEKLKELRKSNNLTQDYVAGVTGVTKSLVCMYESGKRIPSRKTLCKLADLYGVSLDYLIGRQTENDIFTSSGLSVAEDAGNIYSATPIVPIYETAADYFAQKPTRYATHDDVLVDYNNDNLFYVNVKKGQKNIWVLTEQIDEDAVPDSVYVVKTGKTIQLIKGSNLTEKNNKNIIGKVKSVTYLY